MKLNLNNEDNIFELNCNDQKHSNEYLFGDYFGNSLKIFTSDYASISNIKLDSLTEVVEKRNEIDKTIDFNKMKFCRYSTDNIYDNINEFKMCLYDNSIVINICNEDELTDYYIDDDSKTIIGFKDSELGYIKQYISEDEKKQLINKLRLNGVIINKEVSESRMDIIKKIEEENDVYVLQSTDFGSKAWGYAGPDSDDDFRFIYVKKEKDYFSFNDTKTNIEYPIENGDDILGYEVGKFIKFIYSQSPMAYEIVNTPYKDLESIEFDYLKAFSDKYFQPEVMVRAYERILRNNIERLKTEERKSLKLYLYILRMFGIVNYIRSYKKFPTCTIKNVFSIEENKMLVDEIYRLINLKNNGEKNINVSDELINKLLTILKYIENNNKEDDIKIDLEKFKKDANQLYYYYIQYSRNREDMESIIEDTPIRK